MSVLRPLMSSSTQCRMPGRSRHRQPPDDRALVRVLAVEDSRSPVLFADLLVRGELIVQEIERVDLAGLAIDDLRPELPSVLMEIPKGDHTLQEREDARTEIVTLIGLRFEVEADTVRVAGLCSRSEGVAKRPIRLRYDIDVRASHSQGHRADCPLVLQFGGDVLSQQPFHGERRRLIRYRRAHVVGESARTIGAIDPDAQPGVSAGEISSVVGPER